MHVTCSANRSCVARHLLHASLRRFFLPALKQSVEEHRHHSTAAEKQIKHNRKELERLLQEHAQAKGQIQALEAELREVSTCVDYGGSHAAHYLLTLHVQRPR